MGQVPTGAWQVETLAQSARLLAERGESTQAEAVYREILAAAPHHLPALNFLATQAIRRGDHAEAIAHLEQALRAAPDRAVSHQNLAMAHKAAGDHERALAGLGRAAELDPALRTAHLHMGALLEEMGRKDEAVAAYWRAWLQFPAPELLTNPSIAPPHLWTLCLHAAERVRTAQHELIEQALEPLYARHGRGALARVDASARIYLGLQSPVHPHPLQKPSFLYLPGVPPRPFFDHNELGWLDALEQVAGEIRSELQALLEDSDAALAPYVQLTEDAVTAVWQGLNHSKQWSSFHLLRGGVINTDNCSRCPATARILSILPLPEVPGHAPEAFYSVLQPGTHIPPHHGVGNYKLVVHLPLVVPDGCALRVGDETRGWREGECLVFDDSFEHEAWNRSGSTRAVLIIDAWNPLITEAEREGMTALLAAIASFRKRLIAPP
ncbi:MAG TPA: aspartyl/asparaginyl beta-hydroxylase domain-containing protein [Gammaproteobacteria bacterium]|nr:aspartyl/asparaginyl beta-hydroxylase domain-containing protein [Gammaproteobacteria bacterium]